MAYVIFCSEIVRGGVDNPDCGRAQKIGGFSDIKQRGDNVKVIRDGIIRDASLRLMAGGCFPC